MTTTARLLSVHEAARECPDAPCWITPFETWSFEEASSTAHTAMAWLERTGVPLDGRKAVAFRAVCGVPQLGVMMACFHAGIPILPVHPRWSSGQLAPLLNSKLPLQWIDIPETLPSLGSSKLPPPCPDDAATLAVVHTSGTSATPRRVALSRASFARSAAASAAHLGWHGDDRWFLALPLSHVGGLSILLRCLLARKPVALAQLPESGHWDAMASHAALESTSSTLLSLVPTQLSAYLDADVRGPPTLRAVLVGGAAAAPTLVASARASGWPVLCSYGATETCAQVVTQHLRSVDVGDVGLPLPGNGIRIRDDRIEVFAPARATRLWPRGQLNESTDGWLMMEDRGYLDGHGRLHVQGRADDMLISGGENVSPTEVESVLLTHPSIRAAAVYGVPDPHWGQVICAVLVTQDGTLPDDIETFASARLARFQRPRRFRVLSELPLNANGKIDRKQLEKG